MKKLLTLVALMAVALSAQAQYEEGDITIQPKVGMTISNITDGEKSKINLTYGVEFERFFADQFSVALGVMFTDQGCKYDNDTKLDIYYGTLPITANYYVLPGLALKAGIQPAFRVKARIELKGEKVDFDKMVDALFLGTDNKMRTFDLSIPIGLSYEFKRVTVDARYNFGVTKLISNTDKGIYNKVFIMTLGYKF
jgi:hypothetical protein